MKPLNSGECRSISIDLVIRRLPPYMEGCTDYERDNWISRINMSNKAKRNICLILLILEVLAYILIVMFSSQIPQDAKWWIYIGAALLFVFLIGGYRNFSQAVKEDEKYGPVK